MRARRRAFSSGRRRGRLENIALCHQGLLSPARAQVHERSVDGRHRPARRAGHLVAGAASSHGRIHQLLARVATASPHT
eukprot:3130167-Pyramimonas_sp.AAC.1